ncbi:MAG: class I SAM-dependent methyltransferase [Thermoguttaceae bacterium]
MAKDFALKLRRVKARLGNSGSRILDLGCGKGYFVKACLEAGLKAEGLDLSPSAIRYANEVLGVPAICGRIEDVPGDVARYDAVSFWATIEHVPDPLGTLLSIKRTLKSGGYLFLDTGIGYDWLDRLLPGVCQWYDPPQHLYVFSKGSMTNLLARAGFTVVQFDPCFERSFVRKSVRTARNLVAATAIRLIAEATRLRSIEPFTFTRFPLGNLMHVVARADE